MTTFELKLKHTESQITKIRLSFNMVKLKKRKIPPFTMYELISQIKKQLFFGERENTFVRMKPMWQFLPRLEKG